MILPKRRLVLLFSWFTLSNILAGFVVLLLLTGSNKKREIRYSVFASKPLASLSASENLSGEDSRAAIIDQYYARYKCPLTGTGKAMVAAADKYNIPFWIIPSIGWHESTCGKAMIPDSFNPFGYGIYGDVVTKFSSWEEGIDTLGKYLSRNFFSKGITDPCEIEKTYTPPSKGRWCGSIIYFRDQMLNYKTPDNLNLN